MSRGPQQEGCALGVRTGACVSTERWSGSGRTNALVVEGIALEAVFVSSMVHTLCIAKNKNKKSVFFAMFTSEALCYFVLFIDVFSINIFKI